MTIITNTMPRGMVPTITTTTAMLLVWIPILVLLLVVDPLLPAQLQLVVLPQVAAIRRDPLSATTTTTITATTTTATATTDGSNQQYPNAKDDDIHTNKRRRRLASLVDAGAGRVPGSTNTTTTTTTATAGSSSSSLSPPPQRGLIGTNVEVPIPTSPDEHLVTQLPLLDTKEFQETQHWSGLLPVNDHGDGYLFYWLFAPDPETVTARNLPDNDIPLGT